MPDDNVDYSNGIRGILRINMTPIATVNYFKKDNKTDTD